MAKKIKTRKPVKPGVKLPTAPAKLVEIKKAILKAGKKAAVKAEVLRKVLEKPKIDTKTWEEAATSLKAAEKKPDPKKAIPVESHLPGIARSPKPIKRHVPIAAPKGPLGADHLDTLEIISYHFLKLMERLAAEHGGTSTQALEDLRADIAKRKP